MPSETDGRVKRLARVTWADMARWERKRFHRENDSRTRRGLPELGRP